MAFLCFYLLSFFLTLATTTHEQALHNHDLHSLLSFKVSADPLKAALHTWVGTDPCTGEWIGVKCKKGRVISIFLDNTSLTGDVAPLLHLSHLQVLSLRRNALTGSLPHLTNLTNPRLKLLLLSNNQFNGTLSISLPTLISLRLEHNGFSGELGSLQLPLVEDFNVSGNRLSGEISRHLSKFPKSAFDENPNLCGSPLPSCNRTLPMFITTTTSPSLTPSVASTCVRTITKLGTTAILAIGVGDVVVISIALASVIGMCIWLKKRHSKHLLTSSTTSGFDLDRGCVEEKKKDGGLVHFEGGEDLKLECLLKASAEVLGKGVSGSTYKAVLDDGLVVAVKRLNTAYFPAHGKAFDRHLQMIGRLRHSNILSLRAYYNSHEEKLLVYDYMPNGSLHSLLHKSNRRNLRTRGLDWRSRKQILLGAAHGLNYIHSFSTRPPLVHANIKPSNILVDDQGNACITESGIMYAATSIHQSYPPHSSHLFSSTMTSYRAPELLTGKKKATQESDVYSFGMVLLEVVTDKEIDDAEGEGEMMDMVKIGMMCTTECPEDRPKMIEVLRMMSEML